MPERNQYQPLTAVLVDDGARIYCREVQDLSPEVGPLLRRPRSGPGGPARASHRPGGPRRSGTAWSGRTADLRCARASASRSAASGPPSGRREPLGGPGTPSAVESPRRKSDPTRTCHGSQICTHHPRPHASDYCWDVQHLLIIDEPLAEHFGDLGSQAGAFLGVPATGRLVGTQEFAFYPGGWRTHRRGLGRRRQPAVARRVCGGPRDRTLSVGATRDVQGRS